MPYCDSLPAQKQKMRMLMPKTSAYSSEVPLCDAGAFVKQYWQVIGYALPDVSNNLRGDGPVAYMRRRLEHEFAIEHRQIFSANKPYSLWQEYWNKLAEIGRFTKTVSSAEKA
jgi:hypothetical protein